MTGFNYYPHLELLSSLLHPRKVVIGNAPFSIGILKYIDAFMVEGQGWLCDHLQYYGLAKPMFFLCSTDNDRAVEMMFQRCLIHGAGYTSTVGAMPYKDIYDLYRPLLERLFRRRWVFDPDPISLPDGFKGNLFGSPSGSLMAGIVNSGPRYAGRPCSPQTVRVQAKAAEVTDRVTWHAVGQEPADIPFSREDGAVQFDVPGDTVAGVVELRS